MRTWNDVSGQHTVEASLVGVEASVVTLRRRDGTEIAIPLEELSNENRRWVFREVTE